MRRHGAEVAPARMTAAEARDAVERVRKGLEDARLAVLELHDRRGWKALGYPSWSECLDKEFGLKRTYVHYLLEAARIEGELFTTVNVQIPERVLRPLAQLDSPPERQGVWDAATEGRPDGYVPPASLIAALVGRAKGAMSQEALADMVRMEDERKVRARAAVEVREQAEARARDHRRMRLRAGQSAKIAARLGHRWFAEAVLELLKRAEGLE